MIEAKIKKGCNQFFHFLKDLDDEFEVARILAGFSNSSGGELVVGVKDNGKIIGVFPDELLNQLNIIKENYLNHSIDFKARSVNIGRHIVLLVEIESSDYKVKAKGGEEWRLYTRVESLTVLANKIVKASWVVDQTSIQENVVYEEVFNLFQNKKQLSLSYIYKVSHFKKSLIDKVVSQLLAKKVITLVLLNDEVRYQVV